MRGYPVIREHFLELGAPSAPRQGTHDEGDIEAFP